MSENTLNDNSAGKIFPKEVVIKMMLDHFDRLPDIDKKMFNYGPVYLGGNSALAGMVANSLYRRALNVRQARFTSTLPMAVLPFLTTFALYNAAVSQPLLAGDLNCPTCALIRGGLVGVFGGAIYPVILALPVNVGLATRYNTAPMPEKGNVLRFWMDISRPILRKMRAVVVLQAVFGMYLSSRHLDTYKKLVDLSLHSSEEELTN